MEVRNDGGCEGSLTFEVAIQSGFTRVDYSPACMSPIEVVCVGQEPVVDVCEADQKEIDDHLDVALTESVVVNVSSNASSSDSVCIGQETSTSGQFTQIYPAMTIPCPEQGSVVRAGFLYQLPKKSQTRYTSTRASISVSHDGADPGFDITLKSSEDPSAVIWTLTLNPMMRILPSQETWSARVS